MVSAKIVIIFSNFCPAKLLNKYMEMPKILIKSRGKVLGKLNVYKSIWKCQLRFA